MQEQQFNKGSGQPLSRAQVESLRLEALKEAFPGWSEADKEGLQILFRERGWKLFSRYLEALEAALDRRIWSVGLDDRQTTFLRGQRHVLETIKNAPKELEDHLRAIKEGEKIVNADT